MVGFRRIIFSYFLMLVFRFAAATRKYSLMGEDVTLPCGDATDGNCDSTAWSFGGRGLIERGQIHRDAQTKSDRLSLTADCSLVVKNVTVEDKGSYVCKQLNTSSQPAPVSLSVVNMTEHRSDDQVTLSCSLFYRQYCGHSVEWLYEGVDVNMKASATECSATVTFPASHLQQKRLDSFQCSVTDLYRGTVWLFTFKPQSSALSPGRWWLILVAVGLSAVFITIAVIVKRKRSERKETQPGENTAHPEDVSYASVSYTKSTSGVHVRCDGDDPKGEAVIYSMVKAPPSSAGD